MNRFCRAILGLTFWFGMIGCAHAIDVDQVDRWTRAQPTAVNLVRLDKVVALFQRVQARYVKIQVMRPNGAPAAILMCLHYRESDNDFRTHAHNGDSLTRRTHNEPRGRLPQPDPPYTFEQSAEDAYYVVDKLQLTNWSRLQSVLDRMEQFNGLGYRSRGIASPYLWAATSLYQRGKFVSDGRFDPMAVDRQLGCVAILKQMTARGIKTL